jgi:EAL domain-containing protein (putative c-di-GMP-specific phosphodiesterase class I)
MLKELGCDLAQGYYFAKPLPSKALERLLAEGISC